MKFEHKVFALCIVFVSTVIYLPPFYRSRLRITLQPNFTRLVTGEKCWLATKTPYFKRLPPSISNPVTWTKENIPPNLKPVAIDSLYRHGSRFPSTTLSEKWKLILQRLNVQSTSAAVKNIYKKLEINFPTDMAHQLHNKGKAEMKYLAAKLFRMTSTLYSKEGLNCGSFLVLTSNKERCKSSAKAFFEQFMLYVNEQRYDEDLELVYSKCDEKIKVDKSLRAFQYCARYIRTVQENPKSEVELHKFLSSKYFDEIRFLLQNDFRIKLSASEVVDLYKLCTFQEALHDDSSLCELFDINHLKALEYYSDMKHVYKTGYGHRINYELICETATDMIARFDKVLDSPNLQPNVVLRFGHAETLNPLISFLGLFKDTRTLQASNYETYKDERLWKTASIAPFSGNIVFVVYQHTDNRQFYVSLVVNEYMIELPGYTGGLFCPYEIFRSYVVSKLRNLENGATCESVCSLYN